MRKRRSSKKSMKSKFSNLHSHILSAKSQIIKTSKPKRSRWKNSTKLILFTHENTKNTCLNCSKIALTWMSNAFKWLTLVWWCLRQILNSKFNPLCKKIFSFWSCLCLLNLTLLVVVFWLIFTFFEKLFLKVTSFKISILNSHELKFSKLFLYKKPPP